MSEINYLHIGNTDYEIADAEARERLNNIDSEIAQEESHIKEYVDNIDVYTGVNILHPELGKGYINRDGSITRTTSDDYILTDYVEVPLYGKVTIRWGGYNGTPGLRIGVYDDTQTFVERIGVTIDGRTLMEYTYTATDSWMYLRINWDDSDGVNIENLSICRGYDFNGYFNISEALSSSYGTSMIANYNWSPGSLDGNGNYVFSTNRFVSDYIPVGWETMVETIQNATVPTDLWVFLFDKDKSFISSQGHWDSWYQAQQDGYIRIVMRNRNDSDVLTPNTTNMAVRIRWVAPTWLIGYNAEKFSEKVSSKFDWVLGRISAENGNEVSSTNRIRSAFIPCDAGTTVKSTNGETLIWCGTWGKDKTYLSHSSNWSNSYTQPYDGYIRILVRKDTSNNDIASSEIETVAKQADINILFPTWIATADNATSDILQLSEATHYDLTPSITMRRACFTMAVITDIHNSATAWNNFVADVNTNASKTDVAICCGDSVQNPTNTLIPDPTDLNTDYIYCIGNHDVGYTEGGCLSQESIFSKYVQPLITAGKLSGDVSTPYYYKDYSSFKIRVICLYEYEACHYVSASDVVASSHGNLWHRYMSSTQLQWFADTLYSTPEDYSVIVVTHQPIFSSTTYPIQFVDNLFTMSSYYRAPVGILAANTDCGYIGNDFGAEEDPIGDIVNAFIHSGSISETYHPRSASWNLDDSSVEKDFGNRENGNFICYICGHTHASFILRSGHYNDQMQIVLPSGHVTSNGQRRIDDIRPDGTDNYYWIAVHPERGVIKLLKRGSNLTCDMRERYVAEIAYR